MKKLTLFTTAILLTLNSFAQAPNFAWAKEIVDGSGTNIAVDISGNIYTIGTTTVAISAYGLTSNGGHRYVFLSKLDAAGNFIWAKKISNALYDMGSTPSLALDATGNIFITGDFPTVVFFGSITLTSAGGTDIFLAKLDTFGNFVWAKKIGGSGNERASNISINNNGIYINAIEGTNTFILKFDGSGNALWSNDFGVSSNISIKSISTDGVGNVYTTGSFSGTVDFDPGAGTYNLTATAGTSSIFISKLNSSGNFMWTQAINSSNGAKGFSIALDISGNIYTTGYFNGTADFDPGAGIVILNSGSSNSIYISKLNNSGNFILAKALMGAGIAQGESIAIDGSNNIYISGEFNGTIDFDPGVGVINLTSSGGYDFFICKLDVTGNLVWNKSVGGSGQEFSYSLALDSSENEYVFGHYQSSPISYDTIVLTNNNPGMFIAKLYHCPFTVSLFSQTDVSCFGGNNGAATISISGGIGSNHYIWYPSGDTTAIASNLFGGINTCTISDNNGCSVLQTVTIAQPSNITFTLSVNDILCFGGGLGSITINANGGIGILQYSKDGGSTFQSSNIFSGLISGTYQIVVKDANNCVSAPQSVIIAQPTLITFTYSKINVTCFGANTGNITVTATGGTGAYQYSKNGGTTYQASNVFSGLLAGTYNIKIKDANNCTTVGVAVIITQNPIIVITPTHTNLTCHTGNNGTATVSVTGGVGNYVYNWTPTGGNNSTAIGLSATSYTCTVTDSLGCIKTQSYTITAPTSVAFTHTSTNVTTCFGGNNGSITNTASGGAGSFLYSKDGGSTYQLSNVFTGLTMGNYQIVVKDTNNCVTAPQSVNITQPVNIIYTFTQVNVDCFASNTGSITFSASGGTGTKQYSINGGSTYQISNTFSGLAGGFYQLAVKDANNCNGVFQSAFLFQPTSLPTFTYTSVNNICNGGNVGSITVSATGGSAGFQYSKNGGGTFQLSNIFTGLTAGNYPLLIKDGNGCYTSVQYDTITQPTSITTNFTHNNGCFGSNNGTSTLTASGGTGAFTYNWLPYGGTGSTANNLATGTYTVTVTDSNSCTTSANVTITQPSSALTIYNTSIVNTQCGTPTGQITANVSGGTMPYHYMWSNGDTTNVTQNIGAGNYTLTVTDGNGCTTASPVLTVGTTLPNFGVNFTAIATTGAAPFFAGFTNATPNVSSYNFTWFWGDATSTASNNTNVTHTYAFGGFYDVSLVAVNITNGCADTLKKTGYIFVTGTGCTQTSVVSPSAPFTGCTGDTLILTASTNATTYTYQWNVNGTLISGATGNTFAATQTGFYSVTIIEAGCPVTSSVVSVSMSTNPPTPVITATGTIVPCVGGSVALTASPINGGSYLWNTNATSQSITVTTPGAYTVTENYGTSLCSSTSAPFYLGTSLPIVPVCMVSVDSLSTHNVVVWEKTNVGAEVDSFRVYRETMTNVYSNIASVSNDSLSEYHDYGANPNVTSYKYKLVAIDTCGSISGMSDFHNSIHLQYLGNGNLQWTLYDIENAGNPVNFYIINRDDTGTGNFLPISSTIPGGNNTYTDINYANYPNARYRVDVSWNISCTPTRAVSRTRSNIIHLGPNSVSRLELANSITIYPNPFTEQTTITFIEDQENTTIKIMDVMGKEMKTINFSGKKVVIEKGEMEAGIYFVQILDKKKEFINKKIVIQ